MLLYIGLSVTGSLVYEKLYSHTNMHHAYLKPLAPTRQNGQTHLKDLPAVANKLVKCFWPFCGIGTERVINKILLFKTNIAELAVQGSPDKRLTGKWFSKPVSSVKMGSIKYILQGDLVTFWITILRTTRCNSLVESI